MRYNLAKLHSSGNSFIVCLIEDSGMSESRIATLCDPRYGIGGDGLVLIEPHKNAGGYQLSFYNNNGLPFKMSFNGALCAALALKLRQTSNKPIVLHVADLGRMETSFSGNVVSISFLVPLVEVYHEKNYSEIPGDCYSVSMADNHKILLTGSDFLHLPDFITIAKKLRQPGGIFPDGANVHFVSTSRNAVYIRHFEKGIENETLSCGSGCVAAAMILKEKKHVEFVSSGGKLKIKKKEKGIWVISGRPKLIAWLRPGEI